MTIDQDLVIKAIISMINSGVDVTLEPDPFTGKGIGIYSKKALPPIKSKSKLKPGDPGFAWSPCSQCGSTSLRCGCD